MVAKYLLPLTPSVNNIYKRAKDGHVYKSKRARAWEKEAGYIIIEQGKVNFKNATISIAINIKCKKAHEVDVDNVLKLTLDLLEEMQIFDNDKQVMFLSVGKFYGKEQMEIVIKNYEYRNI